jgi:molybdate transport system ATP-binding protein
VARRSESPGSPARKLEGNRLKKSGQKGKNSPQIPLFFPWRTGNHFEGMGRPQPFLTIDQITVRLPNRLFLEDSSWQIRSDQHWAILGPNGSGKTTLVRSLWGGVPLRRGSIRYDFLPSPPPHSAHQAIEAIGYVSLEMHQNWMEKEELREEFQAFAGKTNGAITGQEVILSALSAHRALTPEDGKKMNEVVDLLDARPLLSRTLPSLSTAEMRKALIARALMKSPKLLILDEPFEGLDKKSQAILVESIHQLMNGPMRVVLVVHRLEEIVPKISHVLLVKNGKLFRQGPKEEILTAENLSLLYGCPLVLHKRNGSYTLAYGAEENPPLDLPTEGREVLAEEPETLVEMVDTTVRYGDQVALDRVNWRMKRGENWMILGPNGAGKSTLAKLILGENLQAYANQIYLFGKRKGSGESIWDIKKRIGVVSADLQVQYRKRIRGDEVIASGFYDSIGLFQAPTREQKQAVGKWVNLLGIQDLAQEFYHQLSFGQKRMILLARALVKNPLLLIADEPFHGLDVANRRRIKKILEKVAGTGTHLLLLTDREEEALDCTTHVLQLERGKVVRQGRKEEILQDTRGKL